MLQQLQRNKEKYCGSGSFTTRGICERFSLAEEATNYIPAYRMLQQLQRNRGKYCGGGSITTRGICAGAEPWNIFSVRRIIVREQIK
jgi:hypothetical protein